MILSCGVGRFLRVPWTARRSNQSILKEINPEYSLEGLMLKLKFQYFGYLMWRANLLEKTLMLGKIEDRRRRGRQRMRWLDGTTDWWTWVWVNSGSCWWTGRPGVQQFMGLQRIGHDLVIKPPIFHYTVCVCVCVCVCVHILLRTADKGPSSQMDGFSSSHVWTGE